MQTKNDVTQAARPPGDVDKTTFLAVTIQALFYSCLAPERQGDNVIVIHCPI